MSRAITGRGGTKESANHHQHVIMCRLHWLCDAGKQNGALSVLFVITSIMRFSIFRQHALKQLFIHPSLPKYCTNGNPLRKVIWRREWGLLLNLITQDRCEKQQWKKMLACSAFFPPRNTEISTGLFYSFMFLWGFFSFFLHNINN